MSPSTPGPSLRVLGAGSILPSPERGCSGYALHPTGAPDEPVTLFDCGPGTVRALGAAGIALERVRRVVFSHYHPDHCLDVYALAFARRNASIAACELELVGPPGLRRLVEETPPAFGDWVRDPNATLREVELDTDERATLELPGMTLRCTRNGHTDRLVALSWRIDADAGWSLAYTGDTSDDPRVADLAEGVDLLVSECSFPDGAGTDMHLTPTSAGRLAARARVRHLVLSHLYPGTDPEEARRAAARVYAGPIDVARDGSAYALRSRPSD